MLAAPLVLNTDREWYDHLSRVGAGASPPRVDEVNFWSPKAMDSFGSPTVGEPVFLRLMSPVRAIGGYGFFASYDAGPQTWNFRPLRVA